jgi:hypothetical protein
MTLLTKSEFARAINVVPGRVTQYITARQLTAPALVGEGRAQRVDLELGRAQLKLRLDTDQRFINGLNTKLDDPKPAMVPEDRLGKEVAEFFDAAIPGLVTALAGKLQVSESVAYLVAEERFEALQAVHSTVGES